MLTFTKMHGAGNDFVVIDDREGSVPWQNVELMAGMAARHTGVGCDGVLLIQTDDHADFRMRFLNPDGHEAEMCGNGARCAAWYARHEGIAPESMRIQSTAGPLKAVVSGDSVQVQMTAPEQRRYDLSPMLPDGTSVTVHSINSGVPHAVVWVECVAEYDVTGIGRVLREHAEFAPAGTNVDFIERGTGEADLLIRTYERGVEAETLACGTGMVAAAVVAVEQGGMAFPISVRCASGDLLAIDGKLQAGQCRAVTLTGPACEVYRGELDLGACRTCGAVARKCLNKAGFSPER